jgi:hypothetical protein
MSQRNLLEKEELPQLKNQEVKNNYGYQSNE